MLLVNIIHVNTIAMNKIKNIYRTLILLLSLVLMPVKGWASDGYYVKGTAVELQWSDYIKDYYNYACFYFEKDGAKLDISSWVISNNHSFGHEIKNLDWSAHEKDKNYVYYDKTKLGFETYPQLFQYKIDPKSTDIHNAKLVLLLSNDAELLNQKENLAGVKKMEFDLYTEDGLKSSAVKHGSNSADFSKAESTSIIPTAATSTNVTLPDFNAKYLRWQLFDSEVATTPITTITDILSNSSSAAKGSDLIYYHDTKVADDAARTVSFDFSKLAANVENYVLKCTWANNDGNDAKVVTYNGKTYILQEPTLNGEYSFKFIKQETLDALPLELSADNGAAAASHDVDAIYKDNKLEVSLKDVVSEILSDFGVADKKDVSDFYMRWVLADKDGKIISANSNNSALALRKTSDGVGYYTLLSKEGSSLLPNELNVTFELPSGSSWSSDMKVYCLLTNDLTGHEAKYGVITKEPSAFKSKINVKLYSPDNLPFKHYEGIANKKGDWDMVNGHTYQKTHEWEYYYYVDGTEDKQQILLSLPFQWYEASGNNLEPRGYFRWYDYNTDQESDHLIVCGDETQTKLFKKGTWGLFANNIGAHPTKDRIGVNYSTSHVDASWEGETIACDVSRYIDGMDESRTYLLHEPTLSIRYIFHILPKKKIADDIMTALCNHDDGDYTYEDNKKVTFGYKDQNSETTLRLQLNDISRYSFYPMTPKGLKKVVYNNDITDADFDKSNYVSVPKWGGNVVWRIYDITKKKYCEVSSNSRFLDLTEKKLNDADWYNLEGSVIDASEKPVIDKGIPVFVVAYLKASDTQMCPVANFDVRFMDFHPMTHDQITAAGYHNRTISYLDEHYQMATKPISFDDDDVEQTVAAPTTPNDNQDRLPSRWDRRAYSFVYRDLIDYDAAVTGYSGIGHSPLHGDYGLYKTANISGISGNGDTDNYVWWTDQTLHDRTYEMTNGSQYGHFLYVDASDESRQIAAADFKANLCTGMQMIFSANVADMTHAQELTQVMFKLYGVNYDAEGNILSQKLLHSFSSGDFANNVEDSPCLKAKWYQVYGKIVLQKESGVENYTDFRVVIDNYCKNTEGADYAVDDIRIYIEPAKVQVLQEKPACGGATTGTIKLKIRAIHETLNAIWGHQDTKIYFRFVDEDGKPVTGEGLYSYKLKNIKAGTEETVSGNDYGTVNVYDSEEACKNIEIDGTNMIEVDSEGETYIVISNKDYPLTIGKKYYVSVSTGNPAEGKANWGSPAEICSVYSNWFEMVSQHPIITDTDGNIVTDYKIPCDQAGNYEVKIKGQLTTADPHNGGKITLNNVKFYWYLDGKDDAHKLSETASNEITISKDKLPLGVTRQIYMKPEGTEVDGYIPYVFNGTTYLLCTEAIPVDLRVMKDGPKLNFGFNDVDYPFNDGSYEASLRIGLPQLEKLKEKGGYLKIPLHSASYKTGEGDKTLTFIDDSKSTTGTASANVYVATTNDPLWNATGATLLSTPVATLSSYTLNEIVADKQSTLDLKFSDDVLENFHEGYYYDLRFVFEQRAATAATTSCPGESYLKLKIVPEFITWTPTADRGMNANWNNDDNWHRSSSTELYDNDYPNYQAYGNASGITPKVEIPTLNSYVPMKFTKVTIGNMNGLPFPDLGNIVYRSTNGIATKLTNGKGNEATKYIRYDIMAYWNEAATEKGLDTDGNLECEKFYGNTCHQIYFKPQGELRDQCYLIYDKAWVEKELEPNKWYTMASPLQYIYAGDMYVPASNGRQETKAFTDITFDTNVYSRSKYPVYQRAWMKSGVEEITPNGNYSASHYPTGAVTGDIDMNLGYWSHVYNKVDESYSDAADGTFGGFSIKAGNALLPKDKTENALLRLPKADTEYQYFDYNGTGNSSSKTSVTKDPKGHGKLLVAFSNDEKHLAEKTQSLGTDNNSGFYLVANPYTCSISMAKFFEANSGLQKAIWIVENGEVKAISNTELDMKNYAIQPTQSFFVKKNVGAAIREVRFTSTMCVDRTITPGLLMASDYVKSIEATTENSNGQTSRARIALRPEASADYDDQEDVDLLYDQNLKDIPQVYTVAGNEAVAVNAVPELSWIPLGIVSQQAEEVSLTLKGVNKLDAPVYLYDAASASFTELHEGEAVKVKAGDHGRYFLTQTRTSTGINRMEAEEQSAPVKVYSPAAGMIVVSALGGEKLDRVQVFTLDGKMVHSYQLPDKQRMILRVTSGIYIVKASTQSCAQTKGQKIAVR